MIFSLQGYQKGQWNNIFNLILSDFDPQDKDKANVNYFEWFLFFLDGIIIEHYMMESFWLKIPFKK